MNRWENKVAVVTGASSGIGSAICRKLAQNNITVVGLARRINLVQDLSEEISRTGGKLIAIKCDVSNTEEIKNVFEKIKEAYGPIQILINNAAYLKCGLIIEEDAEILKKVLDTNLLGTTVCAKEMISQTREQHLEGHIINMNSIMGHGFVQTAVPDFNLYPSTKYGLTILCRTLENEIRYLKANVKVTSLSPGLVANTDIFKSAEMHGFSEDAINVTPHILPDDVADAVVYILGTPPKIQVAELTLKHMEESF